MTLTTPDRAAYSVLADQSMEALRARDKAAFDDLSAKMKAIVKLWCERRFHRIAAGQFVDIGTMIGCSAGHVVATRAAWVALAKANPHVREPFLARTIMEAYKAAVPTKYADDQPYGKHSFLVGLESKKIELHSNIDLCYEEPINQNAGFTFGLVGEPLPNEGDSVDEVIS